MPKASAKRRLQFGDDHEKESEADVSPMTAGASASASEISVMKGSSSIVLATPEKKRRRRSNDECETDGIRNHNKQGIALYFSHPKTTDIRKTSVLVTPEKKEDEEKGEDQQQQQQQHVPIYIHKNLNYQRRGQAFLNETLKRVFDLVEEHYVIPSDFESNRSYGPLSGTCFEERVVNAYDRGLLLPNHENRHQQLSNDEGCGSVLVICTHCAALGHRQEDCPDLI
jgi:hypothetical protein